jgi:flavin-binding protein dodecin
MSSHVYKKIELAGSSATSIDDAIRTAIARASESLHNLRWFEVTEIRGDVDDGQVEHWQVSLKVGFTLDDNPHA